jgi:hypothetical protein
MSSRKIIPDPQESDQSNDPMVDGTGSNSIQMAERPNTPDPEAEFSKALGYVKADYEKGWEFRDENSVKKSNNDNYSM